MASSIRPSSQPMLTQAVRDRRWLETIAGHLLVHIVTRSLHAVFTRLFPCDPQKAEKFFVKSQRWSRLNLSVNLLLILQVTAYCYSILEDHYLPLPAILANYAIYAVATAYFCKRRYVRRLEYLDPNVTKLQFQEIPLADLRLTRFKNLQVLEITDCTEITEPFLRSPPGRVPMIVMRNQQLAYLPRGPRGSLSLYTDQLCLINSRFQLNMQPNLVDVLGRALFPLSDEIATHMEGLVVHTDPTQPVDLDYCDSIPQSVTKVDFWSKDYDLVALMQNMPDQVTTLLFPKDVTVPTMKSVIHALPNHISEIRIPQSASADYGTRTPPLTITYYDPPPVLVPVP